MLVKGRIFQLFLVIILTVIYLIYYRLKDSLKINVRRLYAIDAIPEVIGRCAELGRPLYACIGGGVGGRVRPERVASTFAGYNILGYVAELCGKYGVDLIQTISAPTAIPIANETTRYGFIKGGAPEREPDIRYLGGGQYAHSAGAGGIMKREKIAGAIIVGTFGAEALNLTEAANLAGAMVIGGTELTYQVAVIFGTCDYALMGEEMFAASATITKDPEELSNLRGRDISKFTLVLLMLLGAIVSIAGSMAIYNLFSL